MSVSKPKQNVSKTQPKRKLSMCLPSTLTLLTPESLKDILEKENDQIYYKQTKTFTGHD